MKVLIICSEFFAGMMPFGASVTNSLINDERVEVYGIFVSSPQCDYKKAIKTRNKNLIFINTPMGKIKRGIFRIFANPIKKEIKRIYLENKIDIVHLVTEDASLAPMIPFLMDKSEILYTVHDLKSHEEKHTSLVSTLVKYFLVKKRVMEIIQSSKNLITSSLGQFLELKELYPAKNVFFHNFPSLLTNEIITGTRVIQELAGVEDYILFFGRIELYKGIDILYNEYINNPSIQKRPLVIAGSGNIYFQRSTEKEQNVIFINRYIDDNEVKDLFSKAYCSVYPYISATQSGVVSIASHFNIPVVVSDIPFLLDSISEYKLGYSFKISDSKKLVQIINDIEYKNVNDTKEINLRYDTEVLGDQLIEVYHNIAQSL